MPRSNKRKSNGSDGPPKKNYRKFDAFTKSLRDAAIKELAERAIAAKAAKESMHGFYVKLINECKEKVSQFDITRDDITNAERRIKTNAKKKASSNTTENESSNTAR